MTPPPLWRPCFFPIRNIFELNRHIQKTHVLTKFHEDWTKNVTSHKTAPPPGGLIHDDWAIIVTSRVLSRNKAIKNILTKLHEDWASNVTSIVFTSFELSRGINRTNVLTNEAQTINVASGVFTRQNVDAGRRTTHDAQKAITKAQHEHVVLR
ncbi:hypothetical protein DPMN_062789 [Dreissena polymorpha]|uniref:Uncharacterized protein n=1 Tax=Dreissena polymorpha TaxID=45954 RepID=A0A9D4C9T5_DREPO|nr:hypothetical protein DPMN_062789 [Dreissena polymorpha]